MMVLCPAAIFYDEQREAASNHIRPGAQEDDLMDKEKKTARTGRAFNTLSALSAFMLWGGWAYFVNGGHSFRKGLVSGLAQGTASSLITLVMIRMVSFFRHRLPTASPAQAVVLPAVCTVGLTGSCLAGLHYLIGTPYILFTIAPALSVGFAFCLFTAYRLQKKERG
ncbi:MAG: hypothetical protein D3904_15910, partial [Candidatus Electrothrix sp. EH2]|nr:hypothetical protein [Candidatus Electrothrix sp. EH2]